MILTTSRPWKRRSVSDVEETTTFDDWLDAGKWDAEAGNQMNPPELWQDHPFRRAYVAAYLQTYREELQWRFWDGWPPRAKPWQLH